MIKKIFTLIVSILFTLQVFSQTEIVISGKIISQESLLKNIEVINFNTKKTAVSNDYGEFKIAAAVNDKLIILSDKYLDKIILITQEDFNETLIINLSEKPIELEEVKVTTKPKFSNGANYNEIKMAQIEKAQSRPQPLGVYTGEIVNGIDFIQIGKILVERIGGLFKSNKKEKIKEIDIDANKYLKSNLEESFYTKTLHLQASEIDSFIEYCLSDVKFKNVVNTQNKFEIMDYMITKSKEFREKY